MLNISLFCVFTCFDLFEEFVEVTHSFDEISLPSLILRIWTCIVKCFCYLLITLKSHGFHRFEETVDVLIKLIELFLDKLVSVSMLLHECFNLFGDYFCKSRLELKFLHHFTGDSLGSVFSQVEAESRYSTIREVHTDAYVVLFVPV